jgi:hypothetical protein
LDSFSENAQKKRFLVACPRKWKKSLCKTEEVEKNEKSPLIDPVSTIISQNSPIIHYISRFDLRRKDVIFRRLFHDSKSEQNRKREANIISN